VDGTCLYKGQCESLELGWVEHGGDLPLAGSSGSAYLGLNQAFDQPHFLPTVHFLTQTCL
jgi:hypothetical protein